MSKDKDNFIPEEEYRLEDILAEFSDKGSDARPPDANEAPALPPEVEVDLPWPEAPHRSHRMVDFPAPHPPEEPEEPEEPEPEPAPPEPEPTPESGKVVTFPAGEAASQPPTADPSLLEEGLGKLKEKADRFADQMFADEGVEVAEGTRRAEKLIPGVDEEEPPPPSAGRERKPRKPPVLPPDTAPGELYRLYSKGLGLMRLRWLLTCLLCLPQVLLLLAPLTGLPLPGQLAEPKLQLAVTLVLFGAAVLLSWDVWGNGLARLFRGRPGMDTLLACAVLAVATDAVTMESLAPREGQLPYCGVLTVALAFALRGAYLKRRGLRISCRTAAMAQEPYLVTLDEAKWNSRSTYAKHAGTIHGFGSQIQTDDGAQRMFRVAAPVILAGCILLSLLSSVGKGRSEYLPWCLSATLTAAASFGSALVYGKPFHALSKRLSKSGAALAGWEGLEEAGRGVLLTDTDLFPPGSVAINGIKVFGDFPLEKVVALTATLIRESESGLDKLFRDLLRSQGGTYRRCTAFASYEGGMSAYIREERILVGSAAFMSLMEVRLPQGLKVKNAVFCAIDGELAGIFALNYNLHGAIPPALYALIQNKVAPVLATRDFNIIPSMLQQRFKLPVEKMEYPAVERRLELSDPDQPHDPILTAVLCREGLAPFSEAVVGGQRLRRATMLSSLFACLGAVVGVLLAFYLTVNLAFASLSAVNLFLFQLFWLVPTYLISGWVNRY